MLDVREITLRNNSNVFQLKICCQASGASPPALSCVVVKDLGKLVHMAASAEETRQLKVTHIIFGSHGIVSMGIQAEFLYV